MLLAITKLFSYLGEQKMWNLLMRQNFGYESRTRHAPREGEISKRNMRNMRKGKKYKTGKWMTPAID
jgi:hypothetical protein